MAEDNPPEPSGRVVSLHPVAARHGETVTFDRRELRDILDLYGRKVAEGEWRDYAIDFSRDKATFSIFRRAAEYPLYRVEKAPKLARKQGAYSVVTTTGLILKRGHELRRVLDVLDKKLKLVTPGAPTIAAQPTAASGGASWTVCAQLRTR